MAKLYPPIEVINRRKPQPTEGEITLLNFLVTNYDDDYDVYFQPFLNGDLPDIILMHKGGGVMIFEVKDWNLNNYVTDSDGRWKVAANHATLYDNPINQVLKYKANLYNIHIDYLYELNLKDYRYWYVVNCAIYFHCHEQKDAESIIIGPNPTDKYKKFIEKNITILGRDSLKKERMDSIFYKKYITHSKYFTSSLYDSFYRILKPSIHTLEEGEIIHLYPPQNELAISIPGQKKRIKGVAGSGKTMILAHRAVDAVQKTKKDVLVLTYNITLRNYIHDKINKVRQEFSWSYFHITNYHDFINSQITNLCLKPFSESLKELSGETLEKEFERLVYSNLKLFENFEEVLPKYKTILIDEAQDFKEDWFRMILKYFATSDAEVVAFADEKQNVYSRPLNQDKELVVPIQTGRWDQRLVKSARIPAKIAILLNRFQEYFFADKYTIEHIEGRQLEIGEECNIRYINYCPIGSSIEDKERDFANFAYNQIINNSYSPNDVTILATKITTLQGINTRLKEISHEATNVMFETPEEVEQLKKNLERYDEQSLSKEIKKLRKMRKANFWANRGTYKLSTVFSFKGWESPVLFLLIESGSSHPLIRRCCDIEGTLKNVFSPEKFSDELVYTGISRCKKDLYIINADYDLIIGDNPYDQFFNSLPDTIITRE